MKAFALLWLYCLTSCYTGMAFSYRYERQGYHIHVQSDFDMEDVKCFYRELQLPVFIEIQKNKQAQKVVFHVEGGKALPHPQKEGFWLLTADGSQLTLNIGLMDGGKELILLKRHFSVNQLPPPRLHWEINGRKVEDHTQAISIPHTSRVDLVIEVDPDFQKRFPKEARYLASKVNVYTQSGLGSSKEPQTYQSEKANSLSISLRSAKNSGTKIWIEKGRLYRLNAYNKASNAPYSDHIWPPPLVLVIR